MCFWCICFFYFARVNLSFSTSSWCQGLVVASDCGTPWTFLFMFWIKPMGYIITRIKYNIWTDIWAATWQNQQNKCAPSEDSDQPGHPPKLSSYGQRRLWSDWVDAQADLSLRWAHSHFVDFVISRLILHYLQHVQHFQLSQLLVLVAVSSLEALECPSNQFYNNIEKTIVRLFAVFLDLTHAWVTLISCWRAEYSYFIISVRTLSIFSSVQWYICPM